MLITLLVNVLKNVDAPIYSNHIRFFVKSVKTDPTIEFEFFTPPRMSIDRARNEAGKIALETESDYLMFIDDDVMIPNNTLHKLISLDKDVAAGFVIIRGYPFHNMAFKFDGPMSLVNYNELPLLEPCTEGHLNYDIHCDPCQLTPLQEIVKVDAVGFSCCLIKTSLLKKIEPPWFITGINHTEDIYFCLKYSEFLGETDIHLDTSLQCGHLLNGEPVEWSTRRKMQKFYAERAQESYKNNKMHLENNLARLR